MAWSLSGHTQAEIADALLHDTVTTALTGVVDIEAGLDAILPTTHRVTPSVPHGQSITEHAARFAARTAAERLIARSWFPLHALRSAHALTRLLTADNPVTGSLIPTMFPTDHTGRAARLGAQLCDSLLRAGMAAAERDLAASAGQVSIASRCGAVAGRALVAAAGEITGLACAALQEPLDGIFSRLLPARRALEQAAESARCGRGVSRVTINELLTRFLTLTRDITLARAAAISRS
ncbi:hypothetical protein [Actinokineospora cianjurensis]|uniref:Uncharacterized protein n=1 Tax=Actinokineospora cianjurensis TaxID=585224 RepID=A0A421BBK1_9PSEU|nr:hypothetical protein [Actinokineospora cianjurensis]RLK61726.1 hypothetical protein CLV68_2267 [Actinokineospora cianjurensis]